MTIYIMCCESPVPVARSLDSLLPFESESTEVIVADNSESDAVRNVVEERRASFGPSLRYIRHVCNLGGLANLMRSFEVSRAKYLWLNGCNDYFAPGAVAQAEEALQSNPAAFLAFPVEGLNPAPYPDRVTEYTSFADALRELNLGPLASTNVTIYRLDHARRFLPVAYEGLSNLVPQLAILAAGIDPDHRLRFIPTPLIERVRRPRRWDPRKLWMNLSLIYPGPEDWGQWRDIRTGLLRGATKRWVLSFGREDFPLTVPLALSTFSQFGLRGIPLALAILRRVAVRRLKQLARRSSQQREHPDRFS